MSSVNQRGWTPIEDDPRWEEEGYWDKVKPFADNLASKWSMINAQQEQRHFSREWQEDNDRDWEPEEWEFYQAQKRLELELEDIQIEFILNELEKLGCRMMRPYEHWNEDERYMEYMERDRY